MPANMDIGRAVELVDDPLIGARYFFPRPGPRVEQTVDIEVSDDVSLACVRMAVDTAAPWLVHFHGNGELAVEHRNLGAWLNHLGWNVLLAEYRGYGGSGGETRLATMLDDVEAVLGAVPDVARTVVFGRSVGSLFALRALALEPRLAGIVLESGVTDIYERVALRVEPAELGCTDAELRGALELLFPHEKTVREHAAPVLLVHAEHDHLVGIHHAEAVAGWAGSRCTFARLPHGDHNSIFMANRDAYLQSVSAFLSGVNGTPTD